MNNFKDLTTKIAKNPGAYRAMFISAGYELNVETYGEYVKLEEEARDYMFSKSERSDLVNSLANACDEVYTNVWTISGVRLARHQVNGLA